MERRTSNAKLKYFSHINVVGQPELCPAPNEGSVGNDQGERFHGQLAMIMVKC